MSRQILLISAYCKFILSKSYSLKIELFIMFSKKKQLVGNVSDVSNFVFRKAAVFFRKKITAKFSFETG